MDGPTKASLILALVAFIIAVLSMLPTWLKARAEANGNKAKAHAIREQADAKKEQIEADGLDYLVKRAQSNDDTQARLLKSEMNEWRLMIENESLKRERDNLALMLKTLAEKDSKSERLGTTSVTVGIVSDSGANQSSVLPSESVAESSGK